MFTCGVFVTSHIGQGKKFLILYKTLFNLMNMFQNREGLLDPKQLISTWLSLIVTIYIVHLLHLYLSSHLVYFLLCSWFIENVNIHIYADVFVDDIYSTKYNCFFLHSKFVPLFWCHCSTCWHSLNPGNWSCYPESAGILCGKCNTI